MPRLVAVDELTQEQHMWLYSNYGNRGENTAFHENVVVESGTDNIRNTSSCRTQTNQIEGIRQPPSHPSYPNSSEPMSNYGNAYQPPPGPDNRSTIFRGRGAGGRPITRPEYDTHHSYYPYPHHPPLMPIQTINKNSLPDEQREDSSPSRSVRKREREIYEGVPTLEARNTIPTENTFFRTPYVHRATPGSMIPYFEPDAPTQQKRQTATTKTPVWPSNNSDDDSKERKCNPIYPFLGEKLTWLQSYENLQVYKQTYGVSSCHTTHHSFSACTNRILFSSHIHRIVTFHRSIKKIQS